MKYTIPNIPKPSAKRLEKDRKLIIEVHSGWDGYFIKAEHIIPEGAESFEFDFEGPIEHRDPYVLDGDYYHSFYIIYKNSTGSRTEKLPVTPVVAS